MCRPTPGRAQGKTPCLAALRICWGWGRANALLLWSEAAFVSMKTPRSKNSSAALVLPKSQRARASCPREAWKSGGMHALFWLCRHFVLVWGVERVVVLALTGQRGADNKHLCSSFRRVGDGASMRFWHFSKEEPGSALALRTESIWFPMTEERTLVEPGNELSR